jgi:hypothetical protein
MESQSQSKPVSRFSSPDRKERENIKIAGLITLSDINKTIDRFKMISKIIEVNIGEEVPITKEDTDMAKKIFLYQSRNFNKDDFRKAVYGQPYKLNQEITDQDQLFFLKQLLILSSFFIQYYHVVKFKNVNFSHYLMNILQIIRKMFKEKLLNAKHISIITKYFIITTMSHSIFSDQIDRRGKKFRNVLLLFIFLNNFFPPIIESSNQDDANYLIKEIIEFLLQHILPNYNNYFILSTHANILNFLHLLENENILLESKLLINKLLSKIYAHSYRLEIFSFLMKGVRESYINITNQYCLNEYSEKVILKDLCKTNNYIEFLKTMSKINKDNLLEDPFSLSRGFVMNNNYQSGITLGPLITFPKKGYTLIFSFKWYNTLLTEKEKHSSSGSGTFQSLITFIQDKEVKKTEDMNITNLMSIGIENNRVVIFLKERWDTGLEIKPGVSYLCSLVQTEAGFWAIKGKTKVITF